jgi:hypothetical protein
LLSFASPADVPERRSDSLLPFLYPNHERGGVLLTVLEVALGFSAAFMVQT